MRRHISFLLAVIIITLFTLSAAAETKLVIIGDSTVQTYGPERDVRGWGQYFDELFEDSVETVNLAKSGRSTKTFINEGLWEKALAEKGDYILIQFAHNDSHAPDRPESTDAETDYSDYLRKYIDEARAAGAEPVLVTPMHRRLFKNGILTQELAPYANAMKAVAAEKNVKLIDLYHSSGMLLSGRGDDGSEGLYVSAKDRTHFGETGARLMAWLVAKEIGETIPELAAHLKEGAGKMLRHVVLFSFKEGTTEEQLKVVEDAFAALPGHIPAIYDFEFGTNVSPENIARGYSHCFFLTFLSDSGRAVYLPHPEHKAFGKTLRTCMEQVLVVDYFQK